MSGEIVVEHVVDWPGRLAEFSSGLAEGLDRLGGEVRRFAESLEVVVTASTWQLAAELERAHRTIWWARFSLQVEARNRERLKGLL